MTPVVLATDALIWLLVAAVVVYALYCRRRPHLAAPWKRVFQSKAAVVSGVVLGCYLIVGLADSFHYRAAGSVEVQSLLDRALAVLRQQAEKTYSAPLATRLYSKEQMETGRDYPRLRHAGAHLKDESDRGADIAIRAAAGLAAAGALWGLLYWISRPLARRYPQVPFDAAWTTLAAILALAGPIASLAPYYHVLGTNQVGQDVLYLALKSIRTSLAIGTLTTLVLLPLGVALGIMAGYFKGWIDDAIQYLYTTLNSIPGVLLIAAAVLMMQVVIDRHADWFPTAAQRADFRLLVLCAILGLTSWTGLARLGDGLLRPGARRGGAFVRRRGRGSGDDQLRHHDQLGAPRDGSRAHCLVVARRGVRVHVRAGAGGEPLRRCGARRLRSTGESGSAGGMRFKKAQTPRSPSGHDPLIRGSNR
jgi:peptide/nickel transport system permease protein